MAYIYNLENVDYVRVNRGMHTIKKHRYFMSSLVEKYVKSIYSESDLLLTVEREHNKDIVKLFHSEIWYNSVKDTIEAIEDFYLRHNEDTEEPHIYHDYITYLNDPNALSGYMTRYLEFIFNESTNKYEACASSNDEYEMEPIHTILTDIACTYMTATECDAESAIEFATYNLYNNLYSIIFDEGQYRLNDETLDEYYFYAKQSHMVYIRRQRIIDFNQSSVTEFFSNSYDLKFFYNMWTESPVPLSNKSRFSTWSDDL